MAEKEPPPLNETRPMGLHYKKTKKKMSETKVKLE